MSPACFFGGPGCFKRAFWAVLSASWRPFPCPAPAFKLLLDAFCTFSQAFSAMFNCQLDADSCFPEESRPREARPKILVYICVDIHYYIYKYIDVKILDKPKSFEHPKDLQVVPHPIIRNIHQTAPYSSSHLEN